MGQVWECDLPNNKQSVLLALADHAHDDGTQCFPGVAYLAWKTGYTERSVQLILRQLESAEIIEPVNHQNGGRGNTVEYEIHLENAPKKQPYQTLKGEKIAPFIKGERVKSDAQRVKSDALKGEISNTTHIKDCARVLTIIEPSIEPSVVGAVAPAPQKTIAQKKSKPTKYIHGSLMPVEHPFHSAMMKACNVRDSTTDTKKQAVEEAALALFAEGRTVEQCEKFVGNWWEYKFGGAYFGRAPTPKDLRDHFDEVLNLSQQKTTAKRSKSEQQYDASLIYNRDGSRRDRAAA